MQARIYFAVVILTGVVMGTYMDHKIEALALENSGLKETLLAQREIIESRDVPSARTEAAVRDVEEAPTTTPEPPVTFQLDLGRQQKLLQKIDAMEGLVKRYRREATGYQMMIDALQEEITAKDDEVMRIRESFSQYSAKQEQHLANLNEKERDLENAIEAFRTRQVEYSSLQRRVGELNREVRVAEGEACYARAQLAEAAANRILFSRERKKQYLGEALEGYRKALSLGKDEAAQNVQRLERSLLSSVASLE